MNAERFAAVLAAMGADPRRDTTGPWWSARCVHPDHEDDSPSMRFRDGDTQLLVTCFGCSPGGARRGVWLRAVLAAAAEGRPLPEASPTARRGGSGGVPRGAAVARYEYQDAAGRVVARKTRYEPKTFSWDRPHRHGTGPGWTDGLPPRSSVHDLPPYRLVELLASTGPVWVVEGERDADNLAALGEAATCSAAGSAGPPRDLSVFTGRQVRIVVDNDEAGHKSAVRWGDALTGLAAGITYWAGRVPGKGADVSDHLAAGHALADLLPLARSGNRLRLADPEPQQIGPEPVSLADAHAVFRRWLGKDYDTDALDTCLAARAVERLDGDPLWVNVVSGSGNAKTETVVACGGVGAVAVSSISSVGALLSATGKRDRARDATGGLLRVIGPSGALIVKDVTSILSMDRNARAEVLAALREVYDGQWTRNVGTDGGQSLEWSGRIAFLGAVTTAWDAAHSVIAAMGDRFVLVRLDSTINRIESGRQAIGNVGQERAMREALRAAADGVLASTATEAVMLTDHEMDTLLAAANLVTLARTAVEFDGRGDVIDAHAPEMPTRLAKQLAQVLRGAVAVGVQRADAQRLAVRVARDTMPPLRLLIVDDLALHPESTSTEVRRRIGKPRTTVDRQLQALHMLGVVDLAEEEVESVGARGEIKTRNRWTYSLADGVDPEALDVSRFVGRCVKEPSGGDGLINAYAYTNKSGHVAERGLPSEGDGLSVAYAHTNISGHDAERDDDPARRLLLGTPSGQPAQARPACPGCGEPVSHPHLFDGYHVGCAPEGAA